MHQHHAATDAVASRNDTDPGRRLVLRQPQLCLSAAAGEVVLLTGAVGSGKSAWLMRLAGAHPFPPGIECFLDGAAWPGKDRGQARLLPDRFTDFWLGYNVAEELRFGISPQPSEVRLKEMLSSWGLPELALDTPLRSLDRLRAIRLALAALAMAGPSLMLLDNPTAALPVEDGARLRQDVRNWARQSGAVVVAACNRWQDWQNLADQRWQCRHELEMPLKTQWEYADSA